MEPNSQTNPAPVSSPIDQNGHKKIGPIVTTLVIVLVLIIAALYVFASKISQTTNPTDVTGNSSAIIVDETQNVTPIVNTATDLDSIQSDLEAGTVGIDAQTF